MPKVRCADCGFIAVRDRTSRELVEVEAGLRVKWELPTLPNSSYLRYEDFPVCLKGMVSLRIDAPSYNREEVAALVGQERECDAFIEWCRGFSPKEHQEMQLAQELQRQQQAMREQERDWQERRDAVQRDWLAAESRTAREWQQQQNRANRVVQVFLALFAAAVTGLLAYLGYHVDRLGKVPVKNQPTEQRSGADR